MFTISIFLSQIKMQKDKKLIYDSLSKQFKVANFGGTLGLFVGFSFISVWDFVVHHIGFLKIFCRSKNKTWENLYVFSIRAHQNFSKKN